MENHVKKIILATALATMMSTAAFAQFNQSAPQPSADGRGVNVPGTTSTGTAVDRPDSNQAQENARMNRPGSDNGMSSGAGNGMSGGTTTGMSNGMTTGGTTSGTMSR
jgi:hypothetical protein